MKLKNMSESKHEEINEGEKRKKQEGRIGQKKSIHKFFKIDLIYSDS